MRKGGRERGKTESEREREREREEIITGREGEMKWRLIEEERADFAGHLGYGKNDSNDPNYQHYCSDIFR